MNTQIKKIVHVLLIEDDESYSKMIAHKLSASSLAIFKVVCVDSLTAFQKQIQKTKPDIIISDLGLPESSGLDTFNKVIRWAEDVPVVVLTGLDDGQIGVSAVGLGAQEYLVKNAVAPDFIAQSLLHAIERNRLRLELKHSNERLEELAVTDPLTGLLNRRGFERTLSRELAYTKRYGAEFHMVMIDLDNFKSINQNFGHFMGDLALQKVAERIRSAIRPTDYAARIGGDEFLILLIQAQKENMLPIAERILHAIRQEPVRPASGKPFHVTASAGLVHVDPQDAQLDPIIKKVDALLKQSKTSGKNRISA